MHACTEGGRLRGLAGRALEHRSLLSEFESSDGHIWKVFHLWFHFITFGGCSAHLVYHAHKISSKTSNNIIMYWVSKKMTLFTSSFINLYILGLDTDTHTHTHTHLNYNSENILWSICGLHIYMCRLGYYVMVAATNGCPSCSNNLRRTIIWSIIC